MTGAPGAGLCQPLKPGRSQPCGTAAHLSGAASGTKARAHGPATVSPHAARSPSWSGPELWDRRKGRHTPPDARPLHPSARWPAGSRRTRSHCTADLTHMPRVCFPVFKNHLSSHWTCAASSSPRLPDAGGISMRAGPGSGQPGPWKTCAQSSEGQWKDTVASDTRIPQAKDRGATWKAVGHASERGGEERPNAH